LITVTEKVIYQVREGILNGKYAPEQHLHEVSLAEDLKVSRTPIRDALRVLANEELLVYEPNCGYVVRKVALKDVLDAYDARGAVESLACRLVAERGLSADQRTQLEAMLKEGDRIFKGPTWSTAEQAAWRKLNLEFHTAIVAASENRLLPPVLKQLRSLPRMLDARLEPESDFYQQVHTRKARLRAHGEHSELVSALIRRESSRAESLMREHIYRNRETLRRYLEETEVTELSELDEVAPVTSRSSGRGRAKNGQSADRP
jgi:GntR family transcriptional regulator, vanillate catabolism transcriptional regulator